jgi:hypothetical protein
VAATGWNDGAGIGGRPRRRRAVISGHLNERSRLAGRRIRPARPDSGDTGPTGACGFNVHKARCKRRPGGHPRYSSPQCQWRSKTYSNADLPGALAADLPRPVCSLNWSWAAGRPWRDVNMIHVRLARSSSAQACDSCALQQRADRPLRVRARPQLCLDDAEVGAAHVPQLAEPLEGVLEYLTSARTRGERCDVQQGQDLRSMRQMRRVRNTCYLRS